MFAFSVDLKPFLISASDIPVLVLTDVIVCDITVSSSDAMAPPTVGVLLPLGRFGLALCAPVPLLTVHPSELKLLLLAAGSTNCELDNILPESVRFSDIEVVVVVDSGVVTVVTTLVVHTLVVVLVVVVSPSTGLSCAVTGFQTISSQVTDVVCVVSA